MQHGFERMCIVYETLTAMVHFFYLCNHVYSTIYINVDIVITLCFYVFRWNTKRINIINKMIKKTIKLNNQSTISPTSDEEMRHARSSSDANSQVMNGNRYN
jgi:hypothetical protein